MNTYDSNNGIKHICPCCKYEVDWDWHHGFIKGDESFIQIENNNRETTAFTTDKPAKVSWGPSSTAKVILLGCPKCCCVSFKIR